MNLMQIICKKRLFPMMPTILGFISFLCLTLTATSQEISWSKNGCPNKCGNITIPYPFGVGPGCSVNSSFAITCDNSTTPEKPFLSSINREVLNISVHGVVIVNQPISQMNCSTEQRVGSLPVSLEGSPFTISPRYNSLAVLGCSNSVWLLANETTTLGGCMAICQANSPTNGCDGLNCCKADIPERLQSFQFCYRSIQSSSDGLCGYTFPVHKNWFREEYGRYRGLQINQSYPYDQEFVSAPLVLEWEFDYPAVNNLSYCLNLTESSTIVNPYNYHLEHEYVSSVGYCYCRDGYQGNPYVTTQGCIDIDECSLNETYTYRTCTGGGGKLHRKTRLRYCPTGTCINKIGGYDCRHPGSTTYKRNIALISIGSVLGALLLLLSAWKAVKLTRKRVKAKRRQEFFKRNGGLLLQQQLSSTDKSLEKTKVFTYKELAKATDNYNENRILGHGGQGTVYKGMLADGNIVAVKKSKMVEEGYLQDFINEVVVLSQINHRNVVKLLGCCLETEVPVLVYEFITNDTLFRHIHNPSEEYFPLSWEIRLQIMREVAGALAYLHSAASVPIYHRDIKSTNILLDDKYRAKISDFGASRTISIDQTHLTTRVLGTFGYLDPEYFQSSQFTEKSDVYSFGVVMVELITGEKAISSIRAEVGRSLATQFLHMMEEDKVFDIVDERVLREGKREEIMGVAQLARRCLHLNGKRRPTMKEVAVELEGIQILKLKQDSELQQGSEVVEVHEAYDDFSRITDSMYFDANSINASSQEDSDPLLDSP
ncbi:wall-associated receptor kinase-like 6 [Salvia hispanica]|uniref:wall-associated receptor kinase-like 6 n=1 Tax=Salvia hispanica TaxID=49212 RepID=UPI002009C3D9|nr:wall-associated receptor kinase-like 6 [Salvia hispanica]